MATDPIVGSAQTVGTALAPVVGMSADAQIAIIQNLEPEARGDGYARAGYLYTVAQQFTIAGPGTARFSMETGTQGLQIASYEIVSTVENVLAQLVEGATITTTGAAIPGYNLNRNASDAHDAVFKAATAMTGGSVISSEFATANKKAAGGGKASVKIHTLEPSTQYGFRFINQGNQTTSLFFQMAFAEKYDDYNDIWLGGEADNTFRLRGGDTIQLPMIQGQTLSAAALADSQIGVLRQD